MKGLRLLHRIWARLERYFFAALYELSPVWASKFIHWRTIGEPLNLDNPQNFNEKLHWLKLNWKNSLVSQCTDKYGVRQYAAGCGCEEVLNELYGVYEDTAAIVWEELPQKFALKCTHGCGFNIICDDKTKLDRDQTFAQLKKWLKIRYDRYYAEVQYRRIKPRIVCERYIETAAGFLPNDYKMYCFDGKVEIALVCSDRNGEVKYDFLNVEWQRLNIALDDCSQKPLPPQPASFAQMLQYAEKLAQPFPFVRVDFYEYQGRPVLGELTFTPAACMWKGYNASGFQWLSTLLRLPRSGGG
jgi:hypothetical protein